MNECQRLRDTNKGAERVRDALKDKFFNEKQVSDEYTIYKYFRRKDKTFEKTTRLSN